MNRFNVPLIVFALRRSITRFIFKKNAKNCGDVKQCVRVFFLFFLFLLFFLLQPIQYAKTRRFFSEKSKFLILQQKKRFNYHFAVNFEIIYVKSFMLINIYVFVLKIKMYRRRRRHIV